MTTASERLQACLAFTLEREGGYQDRESDPGNWWKQRLIGTNMGISAPTLASWVGPLVAARLMPVDMRNLTVTEARAIYAARYWNAVRGDELPAGVDLMLFDFGVLAGPATSVRMVQSQLTQLGTIAIDGFLGPRTLGAIRAVAPRFLIAGLAIAQLDYLRRLDGFAENGGWVTRNQLRQRAALSMAGGQDV